MSDYANLSNLKYIEGLYTQYLEDPMSVKESWRHFFEGVSFGSSLKVPSNSFPSRELIDAYRRDGHKGAHFNPLGQGEKLQFFEEKDLDQKVPTSGFLKEEEVPLRVLIEALEKTYCGTVGFEYMGMASPELEGFIQEKIEPFFEPSFTQEEKQALLDHLTRAELLENFIHMKYPGQKRFSLEGGESLIPMLWELVHEGGEEGIEQVVLGMAHRGRLNVLTNLLGKPYSDLFHEFESHYVPASFEGSGDVKYHKGYEGSLETKKGKSVAMILCANPSHLEAVDPVVEGKARAIQEQKFEGKTAPVLPLLIHGDASVAGQGVVYETLQLSKLTGYQTGGTIHVVINNHIGFTASPKETKSTRYCTDIAKAFGAPIFHVNAEDPERCAAAAKLAVQVRQKFGCDVFLELNCYRKYGHNEGDEPAFTQPKEYVEIRKKEGIRALYSKAVGMEGDPTFKETLEKALATTKEGFPPPKEPPPFPSLLDPVETAIPLEKLIALATEFVKVPETFKINPKLGRHVNDRLEAISGDPKAPHVDWGLAEHLAYATLLVEGVHVRLSGQDSKRGTFSHRHTTFTDQETAERYYPLSHLSGTQAPFDVYNSPLSEYAVMAFEYGYSLAYEKGLTLWEGQFGDFANGAQIVIDQFIVSSEQKWNQPSALTLLLPHGYEGQGPEHSSGRIERFLQLAGNDSLYIIVPSTPAQFFHSLRRQGVTPLIKPLVIFTPKALLRYPPSLSSPEQLATGRFEEVLDDPTAPKNVRRLIFCSGKVYYDLVEHRKRDDIAIIRIEQLYPLHTEKIEALLKKYSGFTECFWVQEEHANQGAYTYIQLPLQNLLPEKVELRYVGRSGSASTAAGSGALHKKELETFLKEALQ
ncbi:2-oxoglutarate dehydrogenase E1 component [Candidatus Neptunochlamydia vexilliferae]|uniref:2-oxoglutarate dehydrogenase E1 component n=1 Tax=Candidatus Neptunichlamydia vexilliferae TaxID=1651774 RepID=UPI0018916780|nr:2-oxoglutarate dehydrogenase E1 component [Candidatus Neptunochlamydia vexilliferae]